MKQVHGLWCNLIAKLLPVVFDISDLGCFHYLLPGVKKIFCFCERNFTIPHGCKR